MKTARRIKNSEVTDFCSSLLKIENGFLVFQQLVKEARSIEHMTKNIFRGKHLGISLTCFYFAIMGNHSLWTWYPLRFQCLGRDWASSKKECITVSSLLFFRQWTVEIRSLPPPPIDLVQDSPFMNKDRATIFSFSQPKSGQNSSKVFCIQIQGRKVKSWRIPTSRGRFFFGGGVSGTTVFLSSSFHCTIVWNLRRSASNSVPDPSSSYSAAAAPASRIQNASSSSPFPPPSLLFPTPSAGFPLLAKKEEEFNCFPNSDLDRGSDSFVWNDTWAPIFFVDSHPRERCVRVHNFAFYRNSVASSKCPSSYATTNCRRKDQRSKFRVRHHRA